MKFDVENYLHATPPRRGKARLLIALASLVLVTATLPQPAWAQRQDQAFRYYEDAQARFDRGDIGGAVIQLKNALQQDPEMLAAHVLLGRAQLAKGDAAGAEQSLAKAIQLGVDRSVVAVPMAQALYDQGKYEAMFERFVPESLPADRRAEILVLRGHAFKHIGDAQSAAKAVEEARRLNPTFVPALLFEAELLHLRSRPLNSAG